MLTLEDLKNLEPGTIFAKGVIIDSPEGINMTRSGKMLRWVAVRGEVWDWAIYCHWATSSYEYVRDYGDKVYDGHNIKRLVTCDDEAFKSYRY